MELDRETQLAVDMLERQVKNVLEKLAKTNSFGLHAVDARVVAELVNAVAINQLNIVLHSK